MLWLRSPIRLRSFSRTVTQTGALSLQTATARPGHNRGRAASTPSTMHSSPLEALRRAAALLLSFALLLTDSHCIPGRHRAFLTSFNCIILGCNHGAMAAMELQRTRDRPGSDPLNSKQQSSRTAPTTPQVPTVVQSLCRSAGRIGGANESADTFTRPPVGSTPCWPCELC